MFGREVGVVDAVRAGGRRRDRDLERRHLADDRRSAGGEARLLPVGRECVDHVGSRRERERHRAARARRGGGPGAVDLLALLLRALHREHGLRERGGVHAREIALGTARGLDHVHAGLAVPARLGGELAARGRSHLFGLRDRALVELREVSRRLLPLRGARSETNRGQRDEAGNGQLPGSREGVGPGHQQGTGPRTPPRTRTIPVGCGVPNGNRTRVTALKGRSPRPLDDGDEPGSRRG